MFVSHFNVFLSLIGLLLFLFGMRHQTASELFLTIFSFLCFSSMGLWLVSDYYVSNKSIHFIDLFGMINENIALLIPVVIIWLFGKKISALKTLFYIALIVLIGIMFYYTQYFIASGSDNKMIFYYTNKNLNYNLILQLVYDISLFIAFLILLKKKTLNLTSELFTGTYQKVFSLLFIVYYAQDIFTLILIYFLSLNYQIFSITNWIMLFVNLLMAVLIIVLAIYTNWLFLFNRFNLKSNGFGLHTSDEFYLDLKNLGIDITSWMNFKRTFPNDYEFLTQMVDQFVFLTKTEKIYATLIPFKLSQRDISDLLCVSIRTVETNLYRLRTKLKENNRSIEYPYGFSEEKTM